MKRLRQSRLFLISMPLLTVCALVSLAACEKKKEVARTSDCQVERNDLVASAVAVSDGTERVMLNGRRITPVGVGLSLGTFPIGAALSSGGLLAVQASGHGDDALQNRATLVTDASDKSQALDLIDVASWEVRWTIPLRSAFVGVDWSPDGRRLYVSGGGRDVVRVIDVPIAGAPRETTAIEIEGYPTGVRVSHNGNRLYVALMHKPGVAEFDLTGAVPRLLRILTTEAGPYSLVLNADDTMLVTSNWVTTSISRIDLTTGSTTSLDVGKNPEGIALTADGKTAWVAASDEDKVVAVDLTTMRIKRAIDLRDSSDEALGRSPTDLVLDEVRDRLYVVLAHDNSIQVLKLSDGSKLGLLPTAFYPTEIELEAASGKLYSISAKGYGSGPNRNDEAVYRIIRGTVHAIPFADGDQLSKLTEQVRLNNQVGARYYQAACVQARGPLPLQFGDKSSPIKHVIYIMRENKTYDSLLGDLGPQHKGDPQLVVFGELVTPNLHKLARDFANLTNFYSESEQSVQGHIWAGNGWANDFSEKTWIAMWGRPGEGQVILPGIEPASAPLERDLFTHVLRHGRTVRIYGEYSGIVDDLSTQTRNRVNWKFPVGFGIDDQIKVREFIREMKAGKLADFSLVALGNDHTFGGTPGKPTPEYMVADNDAATGLIIEALSQSSYWPETVVFIFEDDPQGQPDHIDAHRTIEIVVSPYTQGVGDRDTLYSNPSMHKTMNLLLGVPPISRHAEIAAAMYDVFKNVPDTRPWQALPSNIDLKINPDDGSFVAEESKKLDFSSIDKAPGLGKILWMMHRQEPYPQHLVAEEDDDD